MSRQVTHPFEPVFSGDSRVLILGSFPSVRSREEGFYYGHPRNRFWPLMALLYGEEFPATIPERAALILRHGLALWDVIDSCVIEGSSDASVRDAVPVNLARMSAPIERVVCNGALAGKLYARCLQPVTGLTCVIAPSTSPANAAWSLTRLEAAWRKALALSSGT